MGGRRWRLEGRTFRSGRVAALSFSLTLARRAAEGGHQASQSNHTLRELRVSACSMSVSAPGPEREATHCSNRQRHGGIQSRERYFAAFSR